MSAVAAPKDIPAPLGFTAKLVTTTLQAVAWGAVLAIGAELIGLWVVWPERGLDRSEQLLFEEWRRLHPEVATALYPWLSWPGLAVGQTHVDYSLAAVTMSLKTYLTRLVVVACSQHAVVILSLAAVVDGCVLRDLRRVSAGIERSKLYHHAKARLFQLYAAPWLIYPCWPWPLDPNWVVLPFHGAFAITLWAWVSLYKKYL